jgi:general secretion pathway protein C
MLLAAAFVLALAPADLKATGVIVCRDGARSVAVLRSGERTRTVSIGETAFGGRLIAIAADGVALEFDGQRVDLRLTPGPAAPAAFTLPPPTQTTSRSSESDSPPRAMDRRDVERRLSQEVPRILAETTAVPVLDEGRVAGLALTRVPEGSLLTDAGLRAGDVITEINGTAIDSLATLMALYPRLQSASELRATVLRNGTPVAISVTLK